MQGNFIARPPTSLVPQYLNQISNCVRYTNRLHQQPAVAINGPSAATAVDVLVAGKLVRITNGNI